MKPKETGEIFTAKVADILSQIADFYGVSQYRLAIITGVSQAQISRVFKHVTSISVPQLYALSDGLGVDPILVVAAAEWQVTGSRPEVLSDKDVDKIEEWVGPIDGAFSLAAKAPGYGVRAQVEAEQEEP